MTQPLRFSGVMPANVLPFTSDLAIDEPAYRRHLRWLADTRGVTGIVANGHASEVSSLSRDERKRSLAIALDEVGGACPIIAGVYSDGTQEAVDLARDARDAGAAGVLVFPPTLFMWGAQLKPEMALRHYHVLADAGQRRSYDEALGVGAGPDPAWYLPEPVERGPEPIALPEIVTGAVLRRIRETRGISLRQIANASKVGMRYLEYIEEDRHAYLPAPVYLRGFLQEYARMVGLDPRRVTESYISQIGRRA